MANELSDAQQTLVSSFLEIAIDQTADTAQQFLQASNWNLEEAIQLFYNGNDNSGLYNDSSSDSEEREQISSSTFATQHDSFPSMYRPSYDLLYDGPFEYAKDVGKARNRWLLVNVQSRKEFSSVMLNRDTWANEIVVQMIKNNFVFWQEAEDTDEGRKVDSYYKLHSLPVILVIDPITGQKMHSWSGMIEPQTLLEDAVFFMECSPSEYHAILIHKQRERIHRDRIRQGDELQEMNETTNGEEDQKQRDRIRKDDEVQETYEITDDEEDQKQIFYLLLPEEPKCDRNLPCRIAIRLPDGRKIQRNFLKTDSIKLLWSFCSTQLEEAETRPFRFTPAMPGASKFLEYDSNLTF